MGATISQQPIAHSDVNSRCCYYDNILCKLLVLHFPCILTLVRLVCPTIYPEGSLKDETSHDKWTLLTTGL